MKNQMFVFRKYQKKIICLFIFALLSSLIFFNCLQVVSEIYDQRTETILNVWKKYKTQQRDKFFSINASEVNQAIANADKAIKLQPNNADYLVRKAKLLNYIQADKEGEDADMRAEELLLYKSAIMLRPAWPYSWADFAMVKARIPELDKEFESALERAMALGPWEFDVQVKMARLGFHFDGWLSAETEDRLNENLKRLSKNYPAQAMKLAKEYQQEARVCEMVKNPKNYPACKFMGSKNTNK